MTLIDSVACVQHEPGEPPASPRQALDSWVERQRELLRPDDVVWVDGTDRERERLLAGMVESGSLLPLDDGLRPGSFLARSDPADVARVEARTFLCSADPADAGPNANWRDPYEMRAELAERMAGAMRGRTMYVVPFSLGPVGGAHSRIGVQLTDSAYVVVSTGTMTRMGADVLTRIAAGDPWVPAVHSVGMPLTDDAGTRIPDVPWPSNPTKIIAHFPQSREIWSYGSAYGGNAILAKKSFALRIASVMAREEGWLAEHMTIVRVSSPSGRRIHIAAAFPSACGKTNFAMMLPTLPGWRVETIGDDIAWLRRGADGRMWALNPEAGLFGVAPGTSETTNPIAMRTVDRGTIFTNTALTPDGDVWWEGMGRPAPDGLVDWRGEHWTTDAGPAAHPNSRFTAPLTQCPSLAADWESPNGVPLDAIVLGGRRSDTVPLVTEATDFTHGVFLGATMSSESTAAAEGAVGRLVFDPFAMRPFCGYDLADHWGQWLRVGASLSRPPRVFRVNWFRRDEGGAFAWPGFGENIRVVDWIARRLTGEVAAIATPIGLLPRPGDLQVADLGLDEHRMRDLVGFDANEWFVEIARLREHLDAQSDRLPDAIRTALVDLERDLWAYIA